MGYSLNTNWFLDEPHLVCVQPTLLLWTNNKFIMLLWFGDEYWLFGSGFKYSFIGLLLDQYQACKIASHIVPMVIITFRVEFGDDWLSWFFNKP